MTENHAVVQSSSSLPSAAAIPLAVDLDGTLVKTDLLVESLFALIRQNLSYLLIIPYWLLRGRAFLKREISRRITLDPHVLPYHGEFLAFLKAQHAQGRSLILAT